MRAIHGAAIGALVLSTIFVTPPGAASAAAPAAPYDAFTANGAPGNYQLNAGTRVIDASNGSFDMARANTDGVGFTARANIAGTSETWSAYLYPPTGQALTPGTTYQAKSVPDSSYAGFGLDGAARGCSIGTSSFTVRELTRNADTQAVTAFAADYVMQCASAAAPMTGALRWHSSVEYAASALSPDWLDLGSQSTAGSSAAKTVTVTSSGAAPVELGAAYVTGTAPTAFTVSSDACNGKTLAPGQSCTVSVRFSPNKAGELTAYLAIPDADGVAQRYAALRGWGIISPIGTYYPLAPARLLDTRSGLGASKAIVGSGKTVSLKVTGRGSVPASGVSAVVLNITATQETAAGFITAYPSGTTRPTASSLNHAKNVTAANAVTVRVGSDGKVALYHQGGSSHIIADVLGFYAGSDTMLNSRGMGGQYQLAVPQRLLDTRSDWGTQLPGGWAAYIPVDFGSDFNWHIRALAVNITVVSPKASGYLAAWNGEGDVPGTSTLNFTANQIVPNSAIVPVAPCPADLGCDPLPSIAVYNSSSKGVHLLVDIFGIYDDSLVDDGLRFRPLSPTRIVDTRQGLGASKLGADKTATVTAPSSVAGDDTYALSLNVASVNPSANTYLTLWPAGISGIGRPTVSTLNPAKGQTVANGTVTMVGPTNGFNIYNHSGSVDVVTDVSGSFEWMPTLSGYGLLGQGASALRPSTSPTLRSNTTTARPKYAPVG